MKYAEKCTNCGAPARDMKYDGDQVYPAHLRDKMLKKNPKYLRLMGRGYWIDNEGNLCVGVYTCSHCQGSMHDVEQEG